MVKTLIGNIKGPPGDKGKTPYIGENGNWWIDGKDTGVEATAGAAAAQSAAAAAQASATAAAKSASDAGTYATSASSSASAAQTAKTAAETAKSGAESAKSAAATSETNAGKSAAAASSSATAAQTAKEGAESAKTAAASSASAAKASETNAASAASSANSSKNAAASSATTAESAAVRAQECLNEVQTKLENGEFDGEDATIEEVTAEVDGSYLAQPTVTVTPGGTPSKRTFHFAFKGLRGLSGGGSGGGGTAVQADWSVNDPNDPSHVKERTHWKEVFDGPEGEIIPETSVSFVSSIASVTGTANGVQIGGKYIVTYNGTDYECIGRDSGDGAYIGNGSILNYGNLADTGEPFCILAFTSTMYQIWKPDSTKETVTVKVVGEKVVIWHKLDKGYLPDDIGYVPRQTVTWDGNTEGLQYFTLDNGEPYYKLSNLTPAKEELLKCVIEIYDSNNGSTRYLYEPVYIDDLEWGNGYAIFTSEDGSFAKGAIPEVIVVLENSDEIEAEPGVYLHRYSGSSVTFLSMTKSVSWGVPKKIDVGCLPVGYPSFSDAGTVLPETAFEFVGREAMIPAITLESDKHYLVNYMGFEYLCKASTFTSEGTTLGVALGNQKAIGGSDTGELFGLITFDPAIAENLGGVQTLLMSVAELNFTSGTISIQKVEPETMNPAFFPKLVVNFTKVNDDEKQNGVCDVTLQEIVEAFEAGARIEGRFVLYGATFILPLVMITKPYMINGSGSSGTYIFACSGVGTAVEVVWAGNSTGQELVTIKWRLSD